MEAIIAIGAGTTTSSSALIGFGLDSVVEVSSAVADAWQFSGRDPQSREDTALRVIAITFFTLGIFIIITSVRSLCGPVEAEPSTIGIILAATSLTIMPFLALAQRRAGRELGSRSAVSDSRQTLLCTYLSGVLLLGLLLNSTMGWSWADPVPALVIAAVALKEGLNAWKGKSCCVPTPPPSAFLPCPTSADGVSALPTGSMRDLVNPSTRAGRTHGSCSCCGNDMQLSATANIITTGRNRQQWDR